MKWLWYLEIADLSNTNDVSTGGLLGYDGSIMIYICNKMLTSSLWDRSAKVILHCCLREKQPIKQLNKLIKKKLGGAPVCWQS